MRHMGQGTDQPINGKVAASYVEQLLARSAELVEQAVEVTTESRSLVAERRIVTAEAEASYVHSAMARMARIMAEDGPRCLDTLLDLLRPVAGVYGRDARELQQAVRSYEDEVPSNFLVELNRLGKPQVQVHHCGSLDVLGPQRRPTVGRAS